MRRRATPLMMTDMPGDFHANSHEAAGHTPDYERLCDDFHAKIWALTRRLKRERGCKAVD